jgi:hypothetical protein
VRVDAGTRARKRSRRMAKTKVDKKLYTRLRDDKKLYTRLRDSGIRKKVAKRVAEAIPAKDQKKPTKAHRVADELTAAANSIRDRAGGGPRKRSMAAKKAARTRKANVPKRRYSAKKGGLEPREGLAGATRPSFVDAAHDLTRFHVAPQEVVLAAKVHPDPDLTVDELAKAMDESDARLRAALPEIGRSSST